MCQMINAAACRMYTGVMAPLAISPRTALVVFMPLSFTNMPLVPTPAYKPTLHKAIRNPYYNGCAAIYIAWAAFTPAKTYAGRLPDSLWTFGFLWLTCCKSLLQFIICNY